MKNKETDTITCDELIGILEIYGSDISRAPAELQAKINDLVAREKEAEKLLKDAAALDTLLDKISDEPALDYEDLQSRIMSNIENNPAAGDHNVTKLEIPVSKPAHIGATQKPINQSNWAEYTVLAASLLLGLMLGAEGIANAITDPLNEVVSINTELQDDVWSIAGDETPFEL